jgi:hypothetical protein
MFSTLKFGMGMAAVLHTVNAAALETYDDTTIREDLSDAENMISPSETPFISSIAGTGEAATAVKIEWPLLELAAVDSSNRVAEGQDAPGIDAPRYASRRSNFTQISDKVVKVSDTSQQVDGAANIEKIAKQISYKLKELKRDKEAMLTSAIAAAPGAGDGATVRTAAGFGCFLITNGARGAGAGAPPTLSGTTSGYPNLAPVAGTGRALSEDLLNSTIQAVWTQGGTPKYVLCSPVNKRLISKTFTGYATKYKNADDKKLISAIDVYESDFGQVQIVPDRFSPSTDVFVIDPEYVSVRYLQPTRQIPLARTGHTDNRMIQCEYSLEVGNEKAQGVIADTTG